MVEYFDCLREGPFDILEGLGVGLSFFRKIFLPYSLSDLSLAHRFFHFFVSKCIPCNV